jgi:hypothetical protein
MVTWPPYILLDVSADALMVDAFTAAFHDKRFGRLPVLGRPILDAGEDGGVYAWPILRVLGKMLDTAMTFMLVEKGIIQTPDQASQEEIVEWIESTRKLAGRWPFGKAKAEALVQLASEIESTFTIAQFFPRAQWPTTVKRRQQLQTSLSFWAVKTVLDALVTLRVQHVPTFADLASGVVWSAVPTEKQTVLEKAIADGSLARRAREFRARIRPGSDAAVMAYALHDAVTNGTDNCGRLHIPGSSAIGLPTQKLH